MAFTILTSFRAITKYPTGDIADATVRTDYMAPALALYNVLMGTTKVIAADTTSDSNVDLAVSWLAASIRYSEDVTVSRDGRRGGLLLWERWRQNAYEIMAGIDRTKFVFSEGVGAWVPKMHDSVWINAYLRNDAEDTETYGA